jgi:mono/diheme cytochrome c family protein
MRTIMKTSTLVMLATLVMLTGCVRGTISEDPPVRLLQNMNSQPKYKAHKKSDFFEDGSAMRVPVAGTVSRGNLRDDLVFYTGKNASGDTVAVSPAEVNLAMLQRGQERYNIYCAPCHSRVGDGRGTVVEHGYVPPPTYHEKRLRDVTDGHIFNVISNGVRNMPGYKTQISVDDRWAIVGYVRALQRSQHAVALDVPENMRKELEPKQ